jgi:hypothetical protein
MSPTEASRKLLSPTVGIDGSKQLSARITSPSSESRKLSSASSNGDPQKLLARIQSQKLLARIQSIKERNVSTLGSTDDAKPSLTDSTTSDVNTMGAASISPSDGRKLLFSQPSSSGKVERVKVTGSPSHVRNPDSLNLQPMRTTSSQKSPEKTNISTSGNTINSKGVFESPNQLPNQSPNQSPKKKDQASPDQFKDWFG